MEKRSKGERKERIQMDIRRIQDRLGHLAQSASDLSNRLDSMEGGSVLNAEDKDLIRMAGMGVIRELGYFYLAGCIRDFENGVKYLLETLEL